MAVEDGAPQVTRRTVLRALGALGGTALAAPAVAGCGGGAAASTVVRRTGDDLIRDRAIAASRALEDEIRTALVALPRLAGVLAPLLAEHERHVAVVAAGYQNPPTEAAPTPARSPKAAPSSPNAPEPSVTVDQAAARAAAIVRIAAAERATGDARTDDILAASGDLARLLASISACELVAAERLGGAR